MTGAAAHPLHSLPGGADYRCRHTWAGKVGSHVCWLPPGHPGPHRCTIGVCAQTPTTTTRKDDR